jgi:hypothetical protein
MVRPTGKREECDAHARHANGCRDASMRHSERDAHDHATIKKIDGGIYDFDTFSASLSHVQWRRE